MFKMNNFHDILSRICFFAGTIEVPAGIPRLHQRRHDYSGWAPIQSQSRIRHVTVRHDPQNVEGPGSC